MRRLRLQLWGTGFLAALLCAVGFAGHGAAGTYELGQRWVYRHEGPRPGSVEPNAIDGQRILHVISSVEEQGETTWVIEERFTNSREVVGRLYVNEARLLTTLDLENDKGEAIALYYDPPVPYQTLEMEVGQTEIIETTVRMKAAQFALPSTITMQRLADETITTPAGEFPDCLHYTATSRSTIDIKVAKIPITEKRERWYHPSVNGLVKELYRRQPVKFLTWSRDGYTATSTLVTFDNRLVSADACAPDATSRGQTAAGVARNSWDRAFFLAKIWLVLLAVLAAPGFVGYGLAKRRGRKHSAR
jgi:hypothetical protein